MPEVREGGETVINKTELLPCPICGGNMRGPITKQWKNCLGDVSYSAWVKCWKCNLTLETDGCGYETEEAAENAVIAVWNTRAPVEYDGWFYLPKPKESIVQYGEQRIEKTEHGYKAQQTAEVIESAIRSWGDELGEYIMKRICEAWSTRSALGNGTCVITPIVPNSDMGRCSACGQIADVASNYCWRCGAKAVR